MRQPGRKPNNSKPGRTGYHFEGYWLSEDEAKILVRQLKDQGKDMDISDLRKEIRY